MQKLRLFIYSVIFIILLIPTFVSSPFAYGFLKINWEDEKVISDKIQNCKNQNKNCIDSELRLDVATPIFTYIAFIIFLISSIISLIYSLFYFRWIRKKVLY